MKNKLAEELYIAHEGLCENNGRIGNNPSGHELTARPPTTKKDNNVNLGLGQGSLEEISTQNGPFNFYSNSMSSCVIQ